jgi:hypothetical protein
MNRDDVMKMAQKAGIVVTGEAVLKLCELVAAAEREAIKWNSIHSCHTDCQNPACVIVREAVAAEREACAKVCENIYEGDEGCGDWPTPEMCAEAIRARGQG